MSNSSDTEGLEFYKNGAAHIVNQGYFIIFPFSWGAMIPEVRGQRFIHKRIIRISLSCTVHLFSDGCCHQNSNRAVNWMLGVGCSGSLTSVCGLALLFPHSNIISIWEYTYLEAISLHIAFFASGILQGWGERQNLSRANSFPQINVFGLFKGSELDYFLLRKVLQGKGMSWDICSFIFSIYWAPTMCQRLY